MTLVVESHGQLPYRLAYDRQLQLVEELRRDRSRPDTCLILEHPPVFTLGRNASAAHLAVDGKFLEQRSIEVIRVERGGEVTYHGPGQVVCYPIVDLRRKALSVVDFVRRLEEVMLDVARCFGLEAGRDRRNRGVWVGGRKLGSVGIAVRHGISFHGLALNVDTDLEPFGWINPCGLSGVTMTSMARELGAAPPRAQVTERFVEAVRRALDGPAEAGQFGERGDEPPRSVGAGKPKWLKKRLPVGPGYEQTRRLVADGRLHTVCQEARCPNQFECYGKGTATFMIMGDRCTRNCGFCAVRGGAVEPLDPGEPARIGAAVQEMSCDYAVLTSVTRDDLDDGGAAHFAATIAAIRTARPRTRVEILIPDLQGSETALARLCRCRPEVLNHNIETVPRLYPLVRPRADYRRSLELLRTVKRLEPGIITKSGLMAGLGEEQGEIVQTMQDLRQAGCDLLTLGQYLQPTRRHLPVRRFVPPEEFDRLRDLGLELGFRAVAAGPHVRSSYRAGQLYERAAGAVRQ